jgi:hypothetical protein
LHSSRQVSTGNWLMLADEVQQNAAIDFPRCPACGNAKILRVDFAQTESLPREFVQVSANIANANFAVKQKIDKPLARDQVRMNS